MDRPPEVEDAIQFIVQCLRGSRRGECSAYGYGVYLPHVMRLFLLDAGFGQQRLNEAIFSPTLSPVFYAAVWELCRRGILRPGVAGYGRQATTDGSGGNGYSVTPFGEIWLREALQADYVPIEPGRFAQMLEETGKRFGSGFVEQSQEAVRAYSAHLFLACCTMCGAAAESIILTLAVQKAGEKKKVLDQYLSGGGRERVEKLILGRRPTRVHEEFNRYTTLLKYWRAGVPYGHAVSITESEAHSALALLLRFARFASDRWDELTR